MNADLGSLDPLLALERWCAELEVAVERTEVHADPDHVVTPHLEQLASSAPEPLPPAALLALDASRRGELSRRVDLLTRRLGRLADGTKAELDLVREERRQLAERSRALSAYLHG